ncbi:hypothetical protein AURDEDRAFT_185112 [Auricularia subglabra TFB-10046 SS5]|nr:hypothetical protein AURDEDRAFT_185112 [Auricularia subglabra TFB-10046 SS5]
MSSHSTPARRPILNVNGYKTPRNSIGVGGMAPGMEGSPSALAPALPFDWDAARGLKPPPYATPNGGKGSRLRKSVGTALSPAKKKVVRAAGWLERIQNIPSRISFQLALFPHNLPLPAPRTSARLGAGAAHALHFAARYAQTSALRDDQLGWEDMLRESGGGPAVPWLSVCSWALVGASLANAAYLATRTREYTHFRAQQPLPSEHARFVPAEDVFGRPDGGGAGVAWKLLAATWRWLTGTDAGPPIEAFVDGRVVQKVDMWMPEEFEKTFFAIYSPVHALLWTFWNPDNWVGTLIALGLLTVQLSILMKAYDALVKDTRILGASVLQEYDEKASPFVQPRINVIRRDACVQTHEAEIVHYRGSRRRYS